MNERVVCADRHAGEFEWPFISDVLEPSRHGCIATENNLLTIPMNDVAVVTAVRVMAPSRSPMLHFEGFDFRISVSSSHVTQA